MKRIPLWAVWFLLTVVLWGVWGWGVYGRFHSHETRRQADVEGVKQQKAAALNLLAAAPALVQQIDSTRFELHAVTGRFAGADTIQQLLDELHVLAIRQGVARANVSCDLASILDIPVEAASLPTGGCILDTLRIEFSAHGRFRAIGAWLDKIEKRADFQQWGYCRWVRGGEDRTVDFSGAAAFWVVTAYPANK